MLTADPTMDDFLPLVGQQLHALGVPSHRGELAAWLASVWPWVVEDPCPSRWAREHAEARRLASQSPSGGNP